jgi:hypothetical protein
MALPSTGLLPSPSLFPEGVATDGVAEIVLSHAAVGTARVGYGPATTASVASHVPVTVDLFTIPIP